MTDERESVVLLRSRRNGEETKIVCKIKSAGESNEGKCESYIVMVGSGFVEEPSIFGPGFVCTEYLDSVPVHKKEPKNRTKRIL